MNMWVLVSLCQTKIWWKTKIVLNGFRYIVYIRADDIYEGIAENVKSTFDTSNYELDKPLPRAKNEKVFNEWKMN